MVRLKRNVPVRRQETLRSNLVLPERSRLFSNGRFLLLSASGYHARYPASPVRDSRQRIAAPPVHREIASRLCWPKLPAPHVNWTNRCRGAVWHLAADFKPSRLALATRYANVFTLSSHGVHDLPVAWWLYFWIGALRIEPRSV